MTELNEIFRLLKKLVRAKETRKLTPIGTPPQKVIPTKEKMKPLELNDPEE